MGFSTDTAEKPPPAHRHQSRQVQRMPLVVQLLVKVYIQQRVTGKVIFVITVGVVVNTAWDRIVCTVCCFRPCYCFNLWYASTVFHLAIQPTRVRMPGSFRHCTYLPRTTTHPNVQYDVCTLDSMNKFDYDPPEN